MNGRKKVIYNKAAVSEKKITRHKMKPSQSEQTFKHECEFFSVQGKNIRVKIVVYHRIASRSPFSLQTPQK